MSHNIIAVSDLHGTLPDIPACDLLLIAGDICPVTNHDPAFQETWVARDFREWLEQAPARMKVFIAGNHDFVFEQRTNFLPPNYPATYLQDSAITWEGLKIWGTPWQPWFFDWAFNLYEQDLKKKWDLIPADTDILVVHGPPRGLGDAVPNHPSPREKPGAPAVRHTGSPSLLERIEEIGPKLVVFGHIHEGRGQWQIGPTLLANVTILDERYNHVYEPWATVVTAG